MNSIGSGLKVSLIENSLHLSQRLESFFTLTLSFISFKSLLLFVVHEIQLFIVLTLHICKLNNTIMILLDILIIWLIIAFIHTHCGYNRCRYGTIVSAVTPAVAVTTIEIGIDSGFGKDGYEFECGATTASRLVVAPVAAPISFEISINGNIFEYEYKATLIFKNLNRLTVKTLAVENKETSEREAVGDYFIIVYNCVLNVKQLEQKRRKKRKIAVFVCCVVNRVVLLFRFHIFILFFFCLDVISFIFIVFFVVF